MFQKTSAPASHHLVPIISTLAVLAAGVLPAAAPPPGVYRGEEISFHVEEIDGQNVLTLFTVDLPDAIGEPVASSTAKWGGDGTTMCPYVQGLFDCGSGPLETGEKLNVGRFNVFEEDGGWRAFVDVNYRQGLFGPPLPFLHNELVPEPLGTCVPGPTTLCLGEGRFAVGLDFGLGGATESAPAELLSEDTGYFYFFDPSNIEVTVKVLDACDLDGFNSFWVFAGGLTDVETTLTVVDTVAGSSRSYEKALGQPFVPIVDTAAFATCP